MVGQEVANADATGTSVVPAYQLLVNGDRRPSSSGAAFDELNPMTRQVMARVANGTVADIDAAIAAAHAAQPAWAALPPAARTERFHRAIEAVTKQQWISTEVAPRPYPF